MHRKDIWKKSQNFISILVGILIVVCIMAIPFLYFKQVDASHYNTRHPMEKISFALDTDAQNVYMVNRIHSYLKSPYSNEVDVSFSENTTLINPDKGHVLLKSEESDIEYITKVKKKGILTMRYDKQSKKVLEVKYKPNHYNQEKYMIKLCSYAGDAKMEKQLTKFWKYLGLDVLDDWYYVGVIDRLVRSNEPYNQEAVYQEAKEEETLDWYIYSESAKLELHAKPEKDGIRYYFKVPE